MDPRTHSGGRTDSWKLSSDFYHGTHAYTHADKITKAGCMVAHAFIPRALRGQRQVELWELKVSLVCIVNLARATSVRPWLKNNQQKRKLDWRIIHRFIKADLGICANNITIKLLLGSVWLGNHLKVNEYMNLITKTIKKCYKMSKKDERIRIGDKNQGKNEWIRNEKEAMMQSWFLERLNKNDRI